MKERVSSAESVPADTAAAAPLLPARAVACLALQTVCYSLLSLGSLELLPFSGANWLGAVQLPVAYAAAGVLGAALLAPWLAGAPALASSRRDFILRALFAAAYQAIVLIFFLRLAGRLAPQPAAAAWEAGAWLFQCALLLLSLFRIFPGAFTGLAFGWIAAAPVFAYLCAELVLVGGGGVSWQEQAKSEHTQAAAWTVRGLVQLSPLTAIMGALYGNLPDGSRALFAWPMALLAVLNGCGLYFATKTVK